MDSENQFKKKIFVFFISTKRIILKFLADLKSGLSVFFRRFNNKNSSKKSFETGKNLDKKLVYSLSKSRIPTLKQLKYIKRFLSDKEIKIIRIFSLILITSILFLGSRFYINHLQVVPVSGGSYSEALIGSVKHINPLYAGISDVDNDISSLIYSSLFKRNKNGELEKDLIESYKISNDGLVYDIKLREDVLWHNGDKLSANDVIFTYEKIKDRKYDSPLRSSFLGIEMEGIDDYNFRFVLAEAYSALPELLTFGIMPQKIWSQIIPEYFGLAKPNLQAIGSGPYELKDFAHLENSGKIVQYNLIANKNYYAEVPKTNIKFFLYSDFDSAVEALNSNVVDGLSYLPGNMREMIITPKVYNYHKLETTRINNIFFNSKNNSALGDKAVRQAMYHAINRNEIISEVLSGNAYTADGPILSGNFAFNNNIKKYDYNLSAADELLNSVDWKISEISEDEFAQAEIDKDSEDENLKKTSEKILEVGVGKWRMKQENYFVVYLTLSDSNESVLVGEFIKKYWENLGIKTILNIVQGDKIESGVIEYRNFEALLYAQELGRDPDMYAFWHSGQGDAEGLNFSNYSNKEVDGLLEAGRLLSDKESRKRNYAKFQEIISEEVPVLFLYSPTYTYVQSKKVKGFDVDAISRPKDRFSNISEWYTQVGKKIIW